MSVARAAPGTTYRGGLPGSDLWTYGADSGGGGAGFYAGGGGGGGGDCGGGGGGGGGISWVDPILPSARYSLAPVGTTDGSSFVSALSTYQEFTADAAVTQMLTGPCGTTQTITPPPAPTSGDVVAQIAVIAGGGGGGGGAIESNGGTGWSSPGGVGGYLGYAQSLNASSPPLQNRPPVEIQYQPNDYPSATAVSLSYTDGCGATGGVNGVGAGGVGGAGLRSRRVGGRWGERGEQHRQRRLRDGAVVDVPRRQRRQRRRGWRHRPLPRHELHDDDDVGDVRHDAIGVLHAGGRRRRGRWRRGSGRS